MSCKALMRPQTIKNIRFVSPPGGNGQCKARGEVTKGV